MEVTLTVDLISGTISTNTAGLNVITPSTPARNSNLNGSNGIYKPAEVKIWMERRRYGQKLKDAFLETPSKDEINRLYDEANVFSLLSHYYWGLWGLIQAMVSDIDFDYMEYAVHRFSEYNRRKGSALAYLDV
jgi:hypothetical protein